MTPSDILPHIGTWQRLHLKQVLDYGYISWFPTAPRGELGKLVDWGVLEHRKSYQPVNPIWRLYPGRNFTAVCAGLGLERAPVAPVEA